ncbi:UDP-N-acetylmuramoyl-L-alanine--D-glutamate ligase [TM7 phylum sp. oral taxon 352]|jgi:UDP-N-acetylmuramoylalanine--D-glutamate ligase|nr:UDP-N-acetylmuramoyl-L-alanine--D-glutamate ligase [TM7 phylum sp. oral taxon 352]
MKIVIAGFGVEGQSNLRYFREKFPEADFLVADEREKVDNLPENVAYQTGFSGLENADLIVRSPSLPPKKIKTSGQIWSSTNEFFANCPATIIGVTGTKGKGTTCSFISSILRAAGKTVHLVGNIGVPALDILPKIEKNDIVVYELSSFQLWDLQKSPHVAVVLMIEPDHLNVHADFNDYLAAKANITKSQTADDYVVYNSQNEFSSSIADASLAQKKEYPFVLSDDIISAIRLPGKHNVDNACAAILAVKLILPNVSDDEIKKGISEFTGLPHRLKFVAEKYGVKYYDDSISTTPGSAIAALKAFVEPKILILGGSDKGADYSELAKEIARQNVRLVIINGANSDEIREVLREEKIDCEIIQLDMATMKEVAKSIKNKAQSGDVVILSPAAASFDMFKSYSDRGEQFVAAVEEL